MCFSFFTSCLHRLKDVVHPLWIYVLRMLSLIWTTIMWPNIPQVCGVNAIILLISIELEPP